MHFDDDAAPSAQGPPDTPAVRSAEIAAGDPTTFARELPPRAGDRAGATTGSVLDSPRNDGGPQR
jgi:hypothetical protein